MTSLMVVLYNFVILSVAPQRGFVVYNNNNKIHSGSGNGRVYADLTPALVGRESISDQSGFAVYLINCKIKKSNVFCIFIIYRLRRYLGALILQDSTRLISWMNYGLSFISQYTKSGKYTYISWSTVTAIKIVVI